jgi:hypothetical protein
MLDKESSCFGVIIIVFDRCIFGDALCAVMRKLAHFIFGVLKNNQPFRKDYACG